MRSLFRTCSRVWLATVALALMGSTGCALFGGGGEAIKRAKSYSVSAPTEWARSERGESDQAYQLKSGCIATLTSSCGRSTNAPLETLTRHLLIGERNLVIKGRKTISVDGETGLYSEVTSTLEGHPFHTKLFVIVKGDCIFDFSLLGTKAISIEETQQFLSFIRSFQYGKDDND